MAINQQDGQSLRDSSLAGTWRRIACDLIESEQRSRSRLAERLHGELQQLLTVALMRTWTAKKLTSEEQLRSILAEVEAVIRDSIDETRSLTLELSPPILRHSDFGKAMEWLTERMQELHGIALHIELTPQRPTVPDHLKLFLFDAIREILLERTAASGVQQAKISIEVGEKQIGVELSGPTTGPAAAPDRTKRNGRHVTRSLNQIADRLEVLGGQLGVDTNGPTGWRVHLTLSPTACADELIGAAQPRTLRAPAEAGVPIAAVPVPTGVIRVLLAEDHRMVRQGLARLINAEPDLCVVAEADDGEKAVELATQIHPDVVVLDVNMPVRNGPDAARSIKQLSPRIYIVGLSEYSDSVTERAMRDAGASAHLCKDGAAEELCRAIRNAVKQAE